MLKLLVVEDEDYVRKTIVSCIDWASIGFEVQEASDGEIALEKVKSFCPNAVITDIKMPILDGLELTEILRKDHPEIVVVIISGHDEFSYAQKAVSFGVWEYLQKPILPSHFTSKMIALNSFITEKIGQEQNISKLHAQLHSSLPLLKEQFLNRLITSELTQDTIIKNTDFLNIAIKGQQYTIIIFSATDEHSSFVGEDALIQFALRNVIEEEVGNRGICFEDSSGKLVMIYCIKDKINEDREFIFTLVDSLRRSNQYVLDFTITASIGAIVDSLSQLPFSYETAITALEQRIIRGKGFIYDYYDFAHLEVEEFQFFSQIDQLILAFHFQNQSEFLHLFKKLDSFILSRTTRVSPISVRIALIDLINGIHKVLIEANHDLPANSNEIYNKILTINRFEELFYSLERYLVDTKKLLDSSSSSHTASIIQKACYYIQQNFSKPELSLNTVAEEVAISPVYLSTLFKKEIGETFIEYVTSMRINEAKKHLKSDRYKNYKIAEIVGYNDPQYFSNCFKKHTGMTPSQFRSDCKE